MRQCLIDPSSPSLCAAYFSIILAVNYLLKSFSFRRKMCK